MFFAKNFKVVSHTLFVVGVFLAPAAAGTAGQGLQ